MDVNLLQYHIRRSLLLIYYLIILCYDFTLIILMFSENSDKEKALKIHPYSVPDFYVQHV